jgi:hypothetical protein
MGNSKNCNFYDCEHTKDNCTCCGFAIILHNFCIVDANDTFVLPGTSRDEWQNEVNGAVPLVQLTQHPESGGVNSCLMVGTLSTTWATMVVTTCNDVTTICRPSRV